MNYVETLSTEDGVWEAPTWEDVEDAIRALDGADRTEVTIGPRPPLGPPDGDHHMMIGGGTAGRVIVYMTNDNLEFWNLEDASKKTIQKPFLMVAGGQEGDYPESQCVPMAWAVEAARTYFESGTRAQGLRWVSA